MEYILYFDFFPNLQQHDDFNYCNFIYIYIYILYILYIYRHTYIDIDMQIDR